MAKKPKHNALHIIRDAVKNPTARTVLGRLSPEDLKTLADEGAHSPSHGDVKRILGSATPLDAAQSGNSSVSKVLAKLPARQLSALSTLYKARGPECT